MQIFPSPINHIIRGPGYLNSWWKNKKVTGQFESKRKYLFFSLSLDNAAPSVIAHSFGHLFVLIQGLLQSKLNLFAWEIL